MEKFEIAILEGKQKINFIIDSILNEYDIENINNQITQEELIKIQKKVNSGIKLNDKEQKIYNFYLQVNEMYFEYIKNDINNIKNLVNLDKINGELDDKNKLYNINEFGDKILNFENIEKYLSEYTKENYTELNTKTNTEAEFTISALYSLIYEEKIKKNQEFQKFRNDWITEAVVKYYHDKNLVKEVNKYLSTQSASEEKRKEWDLKVYNYTKEAVEETLENYLYKNYPEGIKFENLSRDYPNITESGKWIFPDLTENKKYLGSYSPYFNTIGLNDIGTRNRSVFMHEVEHGIQIFLGSNYFQLGNKGYNDNLVDVGRWFQLNDYFIASPSHTSYPYNIRELDSMEITNSDKVKGLFKEIDTKISKEKR